jgi:hypothetical protein
MPTTTAVSRKPACFIGDPISRDQFAYLVEGYHHQHPTEQKSVFIPRQYLSEALAASPNTAGVRFLYGIKDGDPEYSRTIILMSCNEDPAYPVDSETYLINTGECVSTGVWRKMLDRHIRRMSGLLPGEPAKDMPRSCFFGSNSLKALLRQTDCAGILYHFGFDNARPSLPERYQPVLEAVNRLHESLEIFIGNGGECPPLCTPPFFPHFGKADQTSN